LAQNLNTYNSLFNCTKFHNTKMGEVTNESGSMADVSKELKDQLTRLEELFTVPQERLKKITERFMSELDRGLSVEGGTIVSRSSDIYFVTADSASP
jgi:hexokinase